MIPFRDIILHMIYMKRLPTVHGGGIDVPVVCPAFLRKEFHVPGSPGVLLKEFASEASFPFKAIYQRGMTKKQLTFPHDMNWTSFVGELYTPLSVGGYAFIPKEFEITTDMYRVEGNLNWWPEDVLRPYAHLYEEPLTATVERADHDDEQ